MLEMRAKMEAKIEVLEYIERRTKDLQADIERYTNSEDFNEMEWMKESVTNYKAKIKAYETLVKNWFKGDN